MTILNGESLGNDATALTLFRVFVAVAAGTGATVLGGVGMFVLAAVGGVVVGFAVGWVVHRIRRKLDDPQVESALGLVVPFGVYLLAESLHSSGVLAVVVAGIYLGYRSPESGYATRLQDQAVWQASDTILESVVFALIGLQAHGRRRAAGAGRRRSSATGWSSRQRRSWRVRCGCSRRPTSRGRCSAACARTTRTRPGRCPR